MMLFTMAILIFVSMLHAAPVESQGTQVDLSASPITRAKQAISLARAQGHDVTVSDEQLAAFLAELERASFVITAEQPYMALSAGNVRVTRALSAKQYKCSASVTGLYTGLTVNWWAYANVSNGIIQGNPYSTGFNQSYYGMPGSRAVVTGSVTAYTNNGGRRIRLDMNGTASFYFLEIHVYTSSINVSCSHSA